MAYFIALDFPELSVATSSKFYWNWIVEDKFVFTAEIIDEYKSLKETHFVKFAMLSCL